MDGMATADWKRIRGALDEVWRRMNSLSTLLLLLCGLQAGELVAVLWKGPSWMGKLLPFFSSLALLCVCQAWYAAEGAVLAWMKATDKRFPKGTGRALLEIPSKDEGKLRHWLVRFGLLAGPGAWLEETISGFVLPSSLLAISTVVFWVFDRPTALVCLVGFGVTFVEMVSFFYQVKKV
jgi:hypothetical protein